MKKLIALLLAAALTAAATPFDGEPFRTFGQIDSFPILNPAMTICLKSSHGFAIVRLLLLHGFYNHSLEFWRISFVWYSFWHRKTPHLLDSISYCLTSGVLFNFISRLVLYCVHLIPLD